MENCNLDISPLKIKTQIKTQHKDLLFLQYKKDLSFACSVLSIADYNTSRLYFYYICYTYIHTYIHTYIDT